MDETAGSGTRVGVGVVVRSADGLVLLGRRRNEPGDALALPGGKLEHGETVEECAARELGEETGIRLGPGAMRLFTSVIVRDEAGSWLVAGVEGRLGVRSEDAEPRELEPGKVGSFAWVDPATPPPGLYPATAALLSRLEPA